MFQGTHCAPQNPLRTGARAPSLHVHVPPCTRTAVAILTQASTSPAVMESTGRQEDAGIGLPSASLALPRLPDAGAAYCTLLVSVAGESAQAVAGHGLALVRLRVVNRWADLPADQALLEAVRRYCADAPNGAKAILLYEAFEAVAAHDPLPLDACPSPSVSPRVFADWFRGAFGLRRGTLSPGLRVSLGEYVDGACRQHCRRGVVEMFRWQTTAPECTSTCASRLGAALATFVCLFGAGRRGTRTAFGIGRARRRLAWGTALCWRTSRRGWTLRAALG